MTKTVLALVLAAGAAQAQVPPAERRVLLDLYKSTGGDKWTDNTGWSEPDDDLECYWYGVICSHDGHVQKLALDHNNLRGTLPGNLNTLTELMGISAGGNELSGNLPSLAGLRKLEFVSLENNRLSAEIPPLDDLARLTSLFLAGNQLSGPIPSLGGLRQLQFLNLSANKLSGPIPAIAGLSLLHDCFLGSNALSGSIPELRALPNLTYLRVGSNRLTGSVPDLSQVPGLVDLDLKGNALSGPLPPAPRRLSSASLCPNALAHPSADPAIDKRWNELTKTTPWWRDCR